MAAAISTAAPTRRSFTRRSTARSIKAVGASRSQRTEARPAATASAGRRRSGTNRTRRCDRPAAPAPRDCAGNRHDIGRDRLDVDTRRRATRAASTSRRERARAVQPDDDPGVEEPTQLRHDALDVFVAEYAADRDRATAASFDAAELSCQRAARRRDCARHRGSIRRPWPPAARRGNRPGNVTVCRPRSIA